MSPRSVNKEDRRKTILQAATRVFAKHGYQRTTVDQIAEAASVAKGSIYLYFTSKEDLFHALFEDFANRAMELPGSSDAGVEQDGLLAVEHALLSAAETIDSDETVIPLTLEFWSVCGVEETRARFGGSYGKMFAKYKQGIVTLLTRAKSQGILIEEAPIDEIASCLIAMIDGLLIQQWTVPGINASLVIHSALPAFLAGLRNTTST